MTAQPDTLLETRALTCRRGDRVLFDGLDLGLVGGELLYLRGHNGSGKTTLLRALCGLILPTAGEVLWRGRPIRALRDAYTAELLYLGHRNGIKDDLTAAENLRVLAALDGDGADTAQAWDALARIGLRGHEDLAVRVLSQGQKRRVALARLLLTRARLWILDEPFTALDRDAVALLQDVIRSHLANDGLVVLTTHQEVPLTTGQIRTLTLGSAGRSDA
jgi:heme exporter protein A